MILDTGSADFAIPASPECGCPQFFNGTCDPEIKIQVDYGEGEWNGTACTGHVTIGEMSVDECDNRIEGYSFTLDHGEPEDGNIIG